MPKNITDIIDFSQNYYTILGIVPEDLPSGKDPSSRRLSANILRQAYHKKLFEVHPDRPDGDEEKCKLVVKAHMVLSDPILRDVYDRGETENIVGENGISVNWSKIGKYRQGSLADMIGTSIFKKILDESNIENIFSRFVPNDESSHNYHWEFDIEGLFKELVLSIVEDETEVLRLTSGSEQQIKKSLPFKIYLCLPSIKLVLARDEDTFMESETGYLDILKGKIQNARFIDADILGTTDYDYAVEFITSGQLKDAITECINGNLDKFLQKFNKIEENVEMGDILKKQEVNKRDQDQLKELLLQAQPKKENN